MCFVLITQNADLLLLVWIDLTIIKFHLAEGKISILWGANFDYSKREL